MISQQLSHTVESNNIGTISNFSIKASSRAFSILSDGLYSNKIVAIVREIGCNAVDAHKMVGKETLPIEVKLPGRLDNSFYIKDFGPGLSHEQIVGYWTDANPPVYVGGLYNTYFESTKTDSNDFIGALGLGSKSPFSYVSNFIVESRQNGICNVYSCFKDEHGLPAVSLLSSYETIEDNGLTVQIIVNPRDITEFVNAAKTVFAYFDIVPTVLGYVDFCPNKLRYTFSGDNWKMCNYEQWTTDSYSQSTKVIQGLIAYPIDRDILLSHEKLTEEALSVLYLPMHYFVNIGDVEIAASREALSYDEQTICKLIELMEQCAAQMYTIIQNRYNECTSAWEAGITKLTLTSSDGYCRFDKFYSKLNGIQPFLWNNLDIPNAVLITSNNYTSIRSYCRKDNMSRLIYNNTYLKHIPILQNVVIFVDMYKNKLSDYTATLDEYKREHNISSSVKHNIYVISQTKQQSNEQELADILSLFGSDVIIFNMPKKTKKISTSPKVKTTDIRTLNIVNDNPLYANLPINILTDKYLYVYERTGQIYTPDNKLWTQPLSVLLNALTKSVGSIASYGFLGVCHLNKNQANKADKNPNSINLFDYFKNNICYMSLENDATKYIANRVISDLRYRNKTYVISKYIEHQTYYNDINNLKQTRFGLFTNSLYIDSQLTNTILSETSMDDILLHFDLFQNYNVADRITQTMNELVDIQTKYPLLIPTLEHCENWSRNPLDSCSNRTHFVDSLVNYFTLVDNA